MKIIFLVWAPKDKLSLCFLNVKHSNQNRKYASFILIRTTWVAKIFSTMNWMYPTSYSKSHLIQEWKIAFSKHTLRLFVSMNIPVILGNRDCINYQFRKFLFKHAAEQGPLVNSWPARRIIISDSNLKSRCINISCSMFEN